MGSHCSLWSIKMGLIGMLVCGYVLIGIMVRIIMALRVPQGVLIHTSFSFIH